MPAGTVLTFTLADSISDSDIPAGYSFAGVRVVSLAYTRLTLTEGKSGTFTTLAADTNVIFELKKKCTISYRVYPENAAPLLESVLKNYIYVRNGSERLDSSFVSGSALTLSLLDIPSAYLPTGKRVSSVFVSYGSGEGELSKDKALSLKNQTDNIDIIAYVYDTDAYVFRYRITPSYLNTSENRKELEKYVLFGVGSSTLNDGSDIYNGEQIVKLRNVTIPTGDSAVINGYRFRVLTVTNNGETVSSLSSFTVNGTVEAVFDFESITDQNKLTFSYEGYKGSASLLTEPPIRVSYINDLNTALGYGTKLSPGEMIRISVNAPYGYRLKSIVVTNGTAEAAEASKSLMSGSYAEMKVMGSVDIKAVFTEKQYVLQIPAANRDLLTVTSDSSGTLTNGSLFLGTDTLYISYYSSNVSDIEFYATVNGSTRVLSTLSGRTYHAQYTPADLPNGTAVTVGVRAKSSSLTSYVLENLYPQYISVRRNGINLTTGVTIYKGDLLDISWYASPYYYSFTSLVISNNGYVSYEYTGRTTITVNGNVRVGMVGSYYGNYYDYYNYYNGYYYGSPWNNGIPVDPIVTTTQQPVPVSPVWTTANDNDELEPERTYPNYDDTDELEYEPEDPGEFVQNEPESIKTPYNKSNWIRLDNKLEGTSQGSMNSYLTMTG